MTVMSVPAVTAEWNCTRCGSTNRKLVPADTTSTRDRCNHCRTWHIIEPDIRPVRWNARLDD
jgi:DNA-directed RNA polymerase subunit RPC12/RpoP